MQCIWLMFLDRITHLALIVCNVLVQNKPYNLKQNIGTDYAITYLWNLC